jgi:hypothetical protein
VVGRDSVLLRESPCCTVDWRWCFLVLLCSGCTMPLTWSGIHGRAALTMTAANQVCWSYCFVVILSRGLGLFQMCCWLSACGYPFRKPGCGRGTWCCKSVGTGLHVCVVGFWLVGCLEVSDREKQGMCSLKWPCTP